MLGLPQFRFGLLECGNVPGHADDGLGVARGVPDQAALLRLGNRVPSCVSMVVSNVCAWPVASNSLIAAMTRGRSSGAICSMPFLDMA